SRYVHFLVNEITLARCQIMRHDAFSDWCERLFSNEMRRAALLIERACDSYLTKVYRDLNLGKRLAEPTTAADLALALGFIDSADITLEALLWRLSQHTEIVNAEIGDPLRFVASSPASDPAMTLTDIEAELRSMGGNYTAPLELLAFGVEHFSRALGEDSGFMDRLLSGREPAFAELWHRATNVDPLQDVHGVMGAEFIARSFDSGTILEIGGGTGNGIRHLLRRLAEDNAIDRIDKYIFTDISMRFIFETKKEITADYPSLTTAWRYVDINMPLSAQKIEPSSIDVIFAVNAAHVARDLLGFLQECKVCLRPGGQVVFAERIREDPRMMAPRELALNLSIYHRTAAERNADYRPVHCYLTADNWLNVLKLAGFEQAATVPEPARLAEILPSAYATVVTATRP
ncbi:MAG: class I SAM-dependent methyltransferase, partial [Pseudomonadota bacterium]